MCECRWHGTEIIAATRCVIQLSGRGDRQAANKLDDVVLNTMGMDGRSASRE